MAERKMKPNGYKYTSSQPFYTPIRRKCIFRTTSNWLMLVEANRDINITMVATLHIQQRLHSVESLALSKDFSFLLSLVYW